MKEQLKRRLTRKVYDGEYEGSLYNFQQIINKLGKYEDMEDMKENSQSSLSLCVGDIVWSYCEPIGEILPYCIEKIDIDYNDEQSKESIIYSANYDIDIVDGLYDMFYFTNNDINKNVLLVTEESKERAKKEMEDRKERKYIKRKKETNKK